MNTALNRRTILSASGDVSKVPPADTFQVATLSDDHLRQEIAMHSESVFSTDQNKPVRTIYGTGMTFKSEVYLRILIKELDRRIPL